MLVPPILVPPTIPDTPTTPMAPVPPTTPTALPVPTPMLVQTPQVPLADMPAVTDTPVVNLADNDVPLAHGDQGHKCCILHFLILQIALLVELIYTKSMKNRQKKIFRIRTKIADYDIEQARQNEQEKAA